MLVLSRYRYFFIVTIAIALFIFNAFRIVNVSFTHDEAVTFWDFILGSYTNIILCNPPTANNHVLNTLAAKFFSQVFNGYSVPVLRMGTLIALAIYLVYSARLSLQLSNERLTSVAIFLLLNLNIYMFEFWALMRGYGLSWAFMMMALFYFFKYVNQGTTKNLGFLLGASILAIYSNITLLNFFIAISAALILQSLLKKDGVVKTIISLLVASIVIYILIGHIVPSLIAYRQLYYGGDNNVIDDTLMSILKRSFPLPLDHAAWKWVITLIVMMGSIGLYWIICIFKSNNNKARLGLLLWLIPVLVIGSVQIQHYFFDSKLLINRTAIFLYPLIMVPLCYTLSQLSWPDRKITSALLYSLAALAGINFIVNVRINDTYDWEYNKYDVTLLDRMKKDAQLKGHNIKVRPFWMFAPTMNYYAATSHKQWFEPIERNMAFWDKDTSYDYYYINQKEIEHLSDRYQPDIIINLSNETYVLMRKL